MAEKRPDRAVGPEHDEFWHYCDAGELRIQRCDSCGHLNWPPVDGACEKCAHTALTWEHLSGRGKVVSWCTFHQPYYGEMLAIPYDAILVELDEGALFISNPKGFDRDDMVADLPVTLAFIDCEDQRGAFRLPVFEKA